MALQPIAYLTRNSSATIQTDDDVATTDLPKGWFLPVSFIVCCDRSPINRSEAWIRYLNIRTKILDDHLRRIAPSIFSNIGRYS